MIFSKEKNEEIRERVRQINKLRTQGERLEECITYKEKIHGEINDEVDEIFSSINLKKDKEE